MSIRKINIFPIFFQIGAVIICIISFLSPLFTFYIVLYDPPSIPLPLIVKYTLTLFGVTTGNLEELAESQGQLDSILLLKIPGMIIGILIIIFLIIIGISSLLVMTNKWKIEKIKIYWVISGGLILVATILLIVTWTFIGDYLLKSLGSSDAFWGDAAQVGSGFILLFIGGILSIIGYIIERYSESKNLRGK